MTQQVSHRPAKCQSRSWSHDVQRSTDHTQVARTCALRAFGLQMSDVFLWCYVCFVLLRFRLYAFVEAAALRSIVLRYASAPIATRFFVFVLEDNAFSKYFLYHFRFLFVWRESTSYILSFRMVFSTLWPRAGFLTSAYVRIQSIKSKSW